MLGCLLLFLGAAAEILTGVFRVPCKLFLRLTVAYLTYSWKVGPSTLLRWTKASDAAIAAAAAEVAVVKRSLLPKAFLGNVIVNLSLAKQRLTAKYLFSVHGRRLATKKDTFRTGAERSQKMFSDAMTEYETIPPEDHALWDAKAREYVLAQPGMLDQILKILRKDPTSSWELVSDSLVPKNWCCGETIRRLFDACGYSVTYSQYLERALPLMSALQSTNNTHFYSFFEINRLPAVAV